MYKTKGSALEAVENYGGALRDLCEELKKDKEICLAAEESY